MKRYTITTKEEGADALTLARGKRIALAVFHSRWGEIDGALPILFRLKERHPDVLLISLVLGSGFMRTSEEQGLLRRLITEVSDILIYPEERNKGQTKAKTQPRPDTERIGQPRHSKLYRRIRRAAQQFRNRLRVPARYRQVLNLVNGGKLELLLHRNGQEPLNDYLKRRKKPNTIIYPHGTIESIDADAASGAQKPAAVKWLPLLGRASASKGACQLDLTGIPRYDRWWVDRLLSSPALRQSEETARCAEYSIPVAYYARGPKENLLTYREYSDLIKSTARTILDHPDTFLLIRPHPKQDQEDLRKQLAEFPEERWMLTDLQAMQCAQLASIVVSVWSSCILDAAALRKPVIEYFPFAEGFGHPKDSEGNHTSIFRLLGLAEPANNEEEMRATLAEAIKGDSPAFDRQRERAEAFFAPNNGCVDLLIDEAFVRR